MNAGLSGSGTGAALGAPPTVVVGAGDREANAAPGLPVTRRRVARSDVSVARNLAAFLVALLFVAVVALAAGALALLIAVSFYGYGGLG